MYEKYSDILNTFCRVQKENSKNPQDIDCNSKESAEIEQYDSDFHRKRECQNFIETNFKPIKKSEIRKKIISDCKRIYYRYKDDEKFDEEGFSSFWVSFVLDKELPFYEGNYVNGLRDGFGKLYDSSAIYIGEFKNGKLHGKGELKFNSGNSFEGEFVDGEKNGKGIFKWKSGASYEGDYIDGKKNGKGIYRYRNGDVYEGQFVDDKKNGKGIFKWVSGASYEGDWKNDYQEGDGIYTHKSGDIYIGQNKNDLRHGLGTYTWFSSGNKYFGYWLNNSRHGKGILFDKKGKIVMQGIWENSSLVESQKVNLQDLIKVEDSTKFISQNNHESCLKASDYQGCMNYKSGEVNLNRNNIGGNSKKDNFRKTDCIESICSPEDALKYGTDNLGMAVIPGYKFIDDPAERTANYFGSPLKLNVNGNFGRYVHIQRIVRYYSEGRSGYINSTPGIGSNSSPRITYRSGKAPGVRQTLIHNIFDCEDKTFARFNGNKSDRLMESKNKSGKFKKKWLSFDDVPSGFTFNRGKEACNKSKNYIMSLKVSPFTKFEKKAPKSSLKKSNSNINCNSSVWKKRPICN